MTRTRQIIPLCLALMLGTPPLLAQTGSSGPTSAPTAAPGDDSRQKGRAPSSGEDVEKDSGTASGANTKQRANSGGDSPYDYRASEEISEDLPVSFPADI